MWAWRFLSPKQRMTNQSLRERKRLLRGICQCWITESSTVSTGEILHNRNKCGTQYHKISGGLGIFMSEVNWVDHERVLELIFILDPEGTTSCNNKLQVSFILTVIFSPVQKCFKMLLMCSPEGYAVKGDHHPLGGVEDQRISIFDTLQGRAQFWAQVRRPGIGSINVEPQLVFCTCGNILSLFLFLFVCF